MLNRFFYIVLFFALAATASAQNPYLQGKLQGGAGVPGTQSRSPLNSLERAANNLAGATILTDTFGNQRLALFVHIEDTCINYTPAATGNTQNLSAFVEKCGTDSVWYIDWEGKSQFLGGAGAVCDEDWLEISDNSCPDAITDSIYHYKYAAVGARLVWPAAEFLVNDSLAAAIQIIAGDRNARLGFYDNQNQVWSTIDQSGTSTLWYFNPTGEMRWLTAGGGTPQSPGAPFVNQFAIDPNDTPLPTVQAHLYPNTRTDTNTVENFIYTDPVGKFRSRPIDSLIQIVVDSIGGDTTLQSNWYTTNGTTTAGLRVATIKTSAWWRSLDSVGFARITVGTSTLLDDGEITIFQDSVQLKKEGSDALNYITVGRDDISIVTTGDAPFAVDFQTDTVNWRSSFDAILQRHNLLADGTYFFADSLKTVAIGQFPDFPTINFGFFERGIFYEPNGNGLVGIMTNGSTAKTVENLYSGGYSVLSTAPDYTDNGFSTGAAFFSLSYDEDVTANNISISGGVDATQAKVSTRVALTDAYLDTTSVIEAHANVDAGRDNRYSALVDYPSLGGGSTLGAVYIGRSPIDASDILVRSNNLAFGVQQNIPGGDWYFDHMKIDLNSDDTTINTVSLYGRSYYFVNDRPSPTVGDTSFHFWAGNSTDTDPGFMLLDDIRGPGGGENWYTANGTTTDNTRIADVLETATWRSNDVIGDGVVPFRFEIDGGSENEPEALTIVFDNTVKDSVTWSKSDQEIFQTSDAAFVLKSLEYVVLQGDSVVIENNSMAEKTKVRYLIGGTPNNTTLQKVDGNDAGAGEVMMSNGTDWVLTNPSATLRPAQLTATTNNWSPTGWSTYSNQTVVFSGDGNFQTVTGFAAATRDGVIKYFYNDGTNCLIFAKQHTSSSAGNRLDVSKDIVFYPDMSAAFRYDSVGADWELVSTNFDNVSFGNTLNTDLRGNSGFFDDAFWDYNAFGGTSNKSIASSSSLPIRYFLLSTSTAATAYPTITSYTGEIWLRSSGSYLRQFAKVRLEDLSTNPENFNIRWGFTNGVIDTNIVEGAWISYQQAENSGGWTLKTNDGATTTTTNCGAAIAADTWYNLELIYYPYGEVTVFINGTRYTTTSTIPQSITTTPILQIDKDNGTTARILYYSAVELNYVNVSD